MAEGHSLSGPGRDGYSLGGTRQERRRAERNFRDLAQAAEAVAARALDPEVRKLASELHEDFDVEPLDFTYGASVDRDRDVLVFDTSLEIRSPATRGTQVAHGRAEVSAETLRYVPGALPAAAVQAAQLCFDQARAWARTHPGPKARVTHPLYADQPDPAVGF